MSKEKRYRIELSEHQLRLIAKCVEDHHRFASGDVGLHNLSRDLSLDYKLKTFMKTYVKHQVVPELKSNEEYDWAGNGCEDEIRREFIQETYYLYHEIFHQLALDEKRRGCPFGTIYLRETLRCEGSGPEIKVERIQ